MSRTRPRALSRAFSRLFALCAAVCVLTVTGAAFAHGAPMCDEHAQSIVAPFPIFPSKNGEARAAAPCDWEAGRFELGRAPSPDREQLTPANFFERAPPVKRFAPPRDRGRCLPPAAAVKLELDPGFRSALERPPRA